MTLGAYYSGTSDARYPTIALTAANGTTRSNFAEVANSVPVLTLVLSDGTERDLGFIPYATATTYNIFGTAAAAGRLVTPTGIRLDVSGLSVPYLVRTGTPAGDLRLRILDANNTVVSGSEVVLDKDTLASAGNKRILAPLGRVITLEPGTYRAVLDSPSSVNSSNCWAESVLVWRR